METNIEIGFEQFTYQELLRYRENTLKLYSQLVQDQTILREQVEAKRIELGKTLDRLRDIDSEISIRVVRGEPLEQKA